MVKRACIILVAAVVFAACGAVWAVMPTISNVTVSQRTDGSRIVDIDYHLEGSGACVGLRVSDDNGATWNKVYAIHTSGQIGRNAVTGFNNHAHWDAGMDAPAGPNYKAALVAGDAGGVYIGDMVSVPAGYFDMGQGTTGDTSPVHSVFLCAYRIGKYEVTRGEYKQFIQAEGYTTQSYWSTDGWTWRTGIDHPTMWWDAQVTVSGQTYTQTDSNPVIGVTYYEAEAFAKWAGCRLPTEAEWERAAAWTGTHHNVYPWGDNWDEELCNNDHDTTCQGAYETARVGSYGGGVSPCGCMDMAGNVLEWCKDWYADDYYGQTPSGGWWDPQGPTSGAMRVLRGGSFTDGDSGTRCANRSSSMPNNCIISLGFRVAR